jgi:hypothetical protein
MVPWYQVPLVPMVPMVWYHGTMVRTMVRTLYHGPRYHGRVRARLRTMVCTAIWYVPMVRMLCHNVLRTGMAIPTTHACHTYTYVQWYVLEYVHVYGRTYHVVRWYHGTMEPYHYGTYTFTYTTMMVPGTMVPTYVHVYHSLVRGTCAYVLWPYTYTL